MTLMSHGIVGYTLARLCVKGPISPLYWVLAFLAPMLPTLDLFGEKFGYDPRGCYGLQGASHSLFAALVAGLILTLIFKVISGTPGFKANKDCFWGFFLGIASHGLLDAFSRGPGVAVFWPATCARFMSPVRLFEASPVSVDEILRQSFYILKAEVYYVWIPCIAILALDFFFRSYQVRK